MFRFRLGLLHLLLCSLPFGVQGVGFRLCLLHLFLVVVYDFIGSSF
jgi:hypothetical protein